MDKVIAIKNIYNIQGVKVITKGEWYYYAGPQNFGGEIYYTILCNDIKEDNWYPVDGFKTIQEVRDVRLKSILK
jgi:hypothetical protein